MCSDIAMSQDVELHVYTGDVILFLQNFNYSHQFGKLNQFTSKNLVNIETFYMFLFYTLFCWVSTYHNHENNKSLRLVSKLFFVLMVSILLSFVSHT